MNFLIGYKVKRIVIRSVFLVLIISLFNSCAVNRKVDYRNLKLDLTNVKTSDISVALLDHRLAVVDGSRKPSFVGYMRSGVGIAYPMHTVSKESFMEEMTQNIINSFKRLNIEAIAIATKNTETEENVKEKLFTQKTDKKVFFIFNEFHSDGYGIQVLHYDFEVFIYGKENQILAYKKFHDKRKLGGTVAWGPGGYKKYMPAAVTKLFEDIFNDEEIINALNN